MKLRNSALLITALFCLCATASFTQGTVKPDRDTNALVTPPLKIWELRIFEECCFRQSGLEKDTIVLRKEIREYKNEINILREEQKEDARIQRDQDAQITLYKRDLEAFQASLAKEQRRTKRLRRLSWILGSLATVSTGIVATTIVILK